jgi:hypothetical protein
MTHAQIVPNKLLSLLRPPRPCELVGDLAGHGVMVTNVGPRDDELIQFEDALGEWPPIVVMGEVAARRWAAEQWPEAMWSSPLDDNEMARRRFKDLAAAKQAREAEAMARCEAAVRLSTEQLLLFTRLLVEKMEQVALPGTK